MRRKIIELNWMEFREIVPKKIDSVILPVGTIEAHGIIPLGTDVIIPEKLSEIIAGRMNMLIAPTVNYGITRSLLPYPGSMTVSPGSFANYVFEVCTGLVDGGFRKIFIMNGHGGQKDELRTLVRKLWDERKIFSAAISWWLLCEDIAEDIYGEVGGHAGLDETAAVLAIDEGLVHKKRLKKIKGMLLRNGVVAQPFPSSIILYKKGEGMPLFDKEKANLFFRRAADRVVEVMREIISGWRRIE
ncbi:MAG: creatininase family protein [Acidobacteriota bacterium]